MTRQSQFPAGLSLAASEAPVLLNGMRVEFSERVPLYPVDLEHVDEPQPERAR
ncbi:hypothetical protein [Solirubrobacter soli]|uniref:hypothetical protein n=1 Tax=Solirubrobacter soli TaxID=363832 RepID=UPI00041874BE|nr:hypothetical protein [Solirubrobacter soli]